MAYSKGSKRTSLCKFIKGASALLEEYDDKVTSTIGSKNRDTIQTVLGGVAGILTRSRDSSTAPSSSSSAVDVDTIRAILEGRHKDKDNKAQVQPSLGDGDPSLMAFSPCTVCYSTVANVVLVPCGHLVLCSECCDAMKFGERASSGAKCPMCRTEVTSTVKTFRG